MIAQYDETHAEDATDLYRLLDGLSGEQADWYMALVCAALNTADSLADALDLADEAMQSGVGEDDPEAFAEDAEPDRKFSSTQFDLKDAGYSRSNGSPVDRLRELALSVADEDLAEDGREEDFHVTAKYGLHTDDAADVIDAVAGFGSVPVTLGGITLFEGDEADVVKIEVMGERLHELNALLADSLPHTDKHPTYKPHLTLAYVKPGLGRKYVGPSGLEGQQLNFRHLVFSNRQRKQTLIDLERTPSQLKEFAEQPDEDTVKLALVYLAAELAKGTITEEEYDEAISNLLKGPEEFAEEDWSQQATKTGGVKWINKTSGRVVYGKENPGKSKRKAKEEGGKPAEKATKDKPAGKARGKEEDTATKEKKPAAKGKAAGPVGLEQARKLLDGATDLDDLAGKLAGLHNSDLQALKKELKVTAGGVKAEQAKAAAKAALAAVKGPGKPDKPTKPEPKAKPKPEKKPEPEKPAPGKPSNAEPEKFGRDVLGQYDRLKKLVEYQDGLVELSALFDKLKQQDPSLTGEQFVAQIEALWKAGAVNLHRPNGLRTLDRPELSVNRDGSVLSILDIRPKGAAMLRDGVPATVKPEPKKPAPNPVEKKAGGKEIATGHPAIDNALAAAKTPAAKVSALFDASSYFADLAVVGHMKDPHSIMQHMVSTALEGQPPAAIKEAAKAVGISKPTGDVRSQIARQMHERLQQAIRARDTIFGGASDQADAVKRLKQYGYDVDKGPAKGISVPKFEQAKKVIAGPKPPKPGFTGTDALGRRWENGKLVAAKEEETKPDSASAPDNAGQPAEQRAMDKVLSSPVTKVDELRDSLGLGKKEFDALILKLADEGKVILSQDANPAAFTPAQRAKFVQDGDSLITAVMPSDSALAGKSATQTPAPSPAVKPPAAKKPAAQPSPAKPPAAKPAAAPAPALSTPPPAPASKTSTKALPAGTPYPGSMGTFSDGEPVQLPDGAKFGGMIHPRDSKPNPALPDGTRPKLDGAQANAVYDYTAWAYKDVNHALRAGVSGLDVKIPTLVSGTFDAVAKNLDAAFAAAAPFPPPPVEVLRGMSFGTPEEMAKFMKPLLAASQGGGEVALSGYTSTTTDPKAARNFMGSTPRAVLFKIKATQGLDVGPYTAHPDEKELLLNHNSRFRVASVTSTPSNGYTVELEQVPTGEVPPAPARKPAAAPAQQAAPPATQKATPAPAPAAPPAPSPAPVPAKKKGLLSKLLSW